MKTFEGIYTENKIESQRIINIIKTYTFNTEEEISVGDHFKTSEYSNAIQVVKIFNEKFDFINVKTGELKNEKSSGFDVPLKLITIKTETNEENS